ncbi:tetratricopeptide repeat protein [Marilutibacter chinensis]|uniref:Tetratricopeptide repeat protein n=1 Tax=Marilutibacter chinensis TaxID=2912247 RepID=A0ABS9HVJ1_9GAMM|nr:tetratricopeptide repeat protein [Lysobacter chinensis]MCF7222914.1 tetratricopeptide repeat protein [Lysobacter chinensis]
MTPRILLLAALLAVSGTGLAQTMPPPAEFYFDSDSHATKPVVAINETGEPAMQKLLVIIERDPRAHAEAAQLAHMAMQAGRVEIGRSLYQRALNGLSESNILWRPVIWNYGWDLYRAGDAQGALTQWHALLTARGLTATWMPQTLALALWSVDRKDEAVKWYAAAVRSEPDQWRTSARYAELLPDWKESERATLAEVQAAWAENPPTWP